MARVVLKRVAVEYSIDDDAATDDDLDGISLPNFERIGNALAGMTPSGTSRASVVLTVTEECPGGRMWNTWGLVRLS